MALANPRHLYLVIHTPVELARPVVIHAARSCSHYDKLFADYVRRTEEARVRGESRYLMSKVEMQRWTPFFPCGLRAQVVPFTIHPQLLTRLE